jgi:hypothetical protein
MRGVESWGTGRAGSQGFATLLLPIDRTLVDYETLLERSLLALAEFEDRAIDDLVVEIVSPPSAILRLSVEGPVTSEVGVPLELAEAMVVTLAITARASAAAAIEGTDLSAAARKQVVEEYARAVRFGQTEPGSYVMKAVLPARLQLPVDQLGWQVNVPLQLCANLRRLAASVQPSRVESDELQISDWRFGRAVGGALGNLDIYDLDAARVSLSLPKGEGTKREAEAFRFERGALASLAEISHVRKSDGLVGDVMEIGSPEPSPALETIPNYDLEGYVTRLARPGISVRGPVQGRVRTVRIAQVPPRSYETAYRAHGSILSVVVSGTLLIRPTGYATMSEVTRIRIVPTGSKRS